MKGKWYLPEKIREAETEKREMLFTIHCEWRSVSFFVVDSPEVKRREFSSPVQIHYIICTSLPLLYVHIIHDLLLSQFYTPRTRTQSDNFIFNWDSTRTETPWCLIRPKWRVWNIHNVIQLGRRQVSSEGWPFDTLTLLLGASPSQYTILVHDLVLWKLRGLSGRVIRVAALSSSPILLARRNILCN
jgi:hypothetical protein